MEQKAQGKKHISKELGHMHIDFESAEMIGQLKKSGSVDKLLNEIDAAYEGICKP